jgi:hypothetical protein
MSDLAFLKTTHTSHGGPQMNTLSSLTASLLLMTGTGPVRYTEISGFLPLVHSEKYLSPSIPSISHFATGDGF